MRHRVAGAPLRRRCHRRRGSHRQTHQLGRRTRQRSGRTPCHGQAALVAADRGLRRSGGSAQQSRAAGDLCGSGHRAGGAGPGRATAQPRGRRLDHLLGGRCHQSGLRRGAQGHRDRAHSAEEAGRQVSARRGQAEGGGAGPGRRRRDPSGLHRVSDATAARRSLLAGGHLDARLAGGSQEPARGGQHHGARVRDPERRVRAREAGPGESGGGCRGGARDAQRHDGALGQSHHVADRPAAARCSGTRAGHRRRRAPRHRDEPGAGCRPPEADHARQDLPPEKSGSDHPRSRGWRRVGARRRRRGEGADLRGGGSDLRLGPGTQGEGPNGDRQGARRIHRAGDQDSLGRPSGARATAHRAQDHPLLPAVGAAPEPEARGRFAAPIQRHAARRVPAHSIEAPPDPGRTAICAGALRLLDGAGALRPADAGQASRRGRQRWDPCRGCRQWRRRCGRTFGGVGRHRPRDQRKGDCR